MAFGLNNPAWLEWMASLMGGMSRHTYAATFPPDRFYCLLDELPLHLIPRRARRDIATGLDLYDKPLFLNPECVLLPSGELPQQLQDRKELAAGFAQQGTIAWVSDPASGSLLPFWLGPRLESVLRSMRSGEQVPPTLESDERALLAAAGILTPAEHTSSRQHDWDDIVRKSGPGFREKGYAPLSSLIHPFHVAALRRYYRYLIRCGAIRLGDGQSSRRYVAYNDPVARFFHHFLTAGLSALAGEPLKPSYVYMASYLSGAELKKHTDREQCDFSITLCLDFAPEPALETPWPIRLDTPSGAVTVYQALGDGLAYRGTRLPHYRGVLGEGQTSTSIFFHYVSSDFAGSLD
jgi:hypothetical protein